ncbi:MAG: hypothetical protein ACJ0KA_09830 [Verrucomicrobiales bacterium]
MVTLTVNADGDNRGQVRALHGLTHHFIDLLLRLFIGISACMSNHNDGNKDN